MIRYAAVLRCLRHWLIRCSLELWWGLVAQLSDIDPSVSDLVEIVLRGISVNFKVRGMPTNDAFGDIEGGSILC